MADAPEAAASATEATPTTNPEPVQAPQEPEQKPIDLGLTNEQAERFQKFVSANGGFDAAFKKLKTDVSTPDKPVENSQPETKPVENTLNVPQPQEPTSSQPETPPTPPAGAITQDEMMAKYYFEQLSKIPAYATISKEIANGDLLKEMSDLGIEIRNSDGSFNDAQINTYLSIKAQTVPATPSGADPDASQAPTVSYANVGEKVTTMEQARVVLSQPGHPAMESAKEFLKNTLNPTVEK